MDIFAEAEWRNKLTEMSDEAFKGCGLSDVIFARRFSLSVDLAIQGLPDRDREKVIALAEGIGIYLDGNEEVIDDGACPHGIDLGYCPAGCGSH